MSLRTPLLAALTGCVLLLGGAHAGATCVAPSAPGTFPDGATATKEEMLAGKKSVSDYVAAADDYISCVTAETPKYDAKKQYSDKDKAALSATQTAAQKQIDEVETTKATVAERFNVQLRAYKAKLAAAPPQN